MCLSCVFNYAIGMYIHTYIKMLPLEVCKKYYNDRPITLRSKHYELIHTLLKNGLSAILYFVRQLVEGQRFAEFLTTVTTTQYQNTVTFCSGFEPTYLYMLQQHQCPSLLYYSLDFKVADTLTVMVFLFQYVNRNTRFLFFLRHIM